MALKLSYNFPPHTYRSRSRSPYGDRHRRGKGRSTSRDRRDRREDDKRDDERRREREKKGLPPMRKGFLSGRNL